jgi:CheY-like chemotaxis protein
MLNTINTCGQDLINILNDVLDISKMESKKLHIENIAFDLQKTMEDLSFLFIPRAKERGNKLELKMDPSLNHYYFGDPLRIKQIIGNFISNAIKFTENGKVLISVKSEFINGQEQIKIGVKDSGTGIKKENQAKIFEAFSQEDSSTTRVYGGTGLGLSIASNLAHLMNAKIDLESEYGKGSCFYLILRLQRAEEENVLETQKKEDSQKKLSTQELEKQDFGELRILLVEDNPINQKLVKAFLSKLGYTADTAINGAEAIESINHNTYDIILMDVQMPVMDGVTATKNIRNMEIDQPYIVALTANILPEDVQKYIDAGMDTHLGKPVSKDELSQVLLNVSKVIKEKAS